MYQSLWKSITLLTASLKNATEEEQLEHQLMVHPNKLGGFDASSYFRKEDERKQSIMSTGIVTMIL